MISGTRTAISRLALATGAVALTLGAAACSGGDDPAETGGSGQDDPAPVSDSGGTDPSDGGGPAPSDGGGEKATSPLDDEQLDAASARFVEAVKVLDDGDWEAACAYVLDPTTGTAPEGQRLTACAEKAGEALEGGDALEPGAFDALDVAFVEAEDTGQDTVSITVAGTPVETPMISGSDGQWYFSIPF